LAEPAVAESAAEVPRESAVQAPVETLVEAAPVVVEPAPSELEEAPAVSSGSATPADPPRSARLPISEVLDRLKAEDAGEAPAPLAIPTPRPPPPATPGWSEDFMKDDPADEIVIGPRFPSSGASAFRSEPPWADAEEDGHEPYWAAPSRRLSATASAIAERVRQIGERPAQPWQVIGAAALISALVGVGVMVANPAPPVTDSHAFTSDPVPARPGLPAASAGSAGSSDGASSPSAQPPGNEGIVTASVLSCRSAPSKSARRVRNMMKGQRAEIVGHAGDWVALARRSTQCWAQARFVTTVARD
jgi:hypothetical protein